MKTTNIDRDDEENELFLVTLYYITQFVLIRPTLRNVDERKVKKKVYNSNNE